MMDRATLHDSVNSEHCTHALCNANVIVAVLEAMKTMMITRGRKSCWRWRMVKWALAMRAHQDNRSRIPSPRRRQTAVGIGSQSQGVVAE